MPLDLSLDPETAHGIFTVIVFAVAAILLLSMFELAGGVGLTIDRVMESILGWDRIILPFFLIAIGIHEISAERLPLKASNYIGFVLFFLSLNPLVHVLSAANLNQSSEEILEASGKIGALISPPLLSALGRFGTITIFLALTVASLLLIFNTSLKRVAELFFGIINLLQKILLMIIFPFRWFWGFFANKREERLRAKVVIKQIEQTTSESEPEEESKKDAEDSALEANIIHEIKPSPKPKKRHPKIEIPLELLTRRDQKPSAGDIQYNQLIIQKTLENFGIPVEMAEVSVGPTVTQFTFKPAEGIKLSRITALHNDLALALAAHPIRIEAPIPGKSLVGVEVPNQSVATVGLREMFESRDWKERRDRFSFSLGRDVSGKPWITEIGRMPHLLVAGATGSGKSVCLNTIIISLLSSLGPDDVKFIMVDPKRVELQIYNGIPHLITPVITEVEKTVNALKWALREMDRRFDVLSKFGARDIGAYNSKSEEKLPYIALIIDELADLMVTAAQEVEGPIVRLAQMSRAVGIHLILATQRPSVDVLTGLIKANIPARIAFAVASSTDSRTIIDQSGAEKLLGRGDLLFQTADMSSPKRVQGSFVADDEIGRIVNFLRSRYEPAEYDPNVVERLSGHGTAFSNGLADDDSDPLLSEAKEEILRAGRGSASLLQRRLKIGYARAARILDLLEQEGFISPGNGAKPREILKAEFTKGLEQVPTVAETVLAHDSLESDDSDFKTEE